MERVNQNRLRRTYWLLWSPNHHHFSWHINTSLQLCQQVKEDNPPAYWGSNPRTSVYEANALPLTPQQTACDYMTKLYYVMSFKIIFLKAYFTVIQHFNLSISCLTVFILLLRTYTLLTQNTIHIYRYVGCRVTLSTPSTGPDYDKR